MIQTQVILDSYRSLKDGSLKITFETQDGQLNREAISELMDCAGQFGVLAFQRGQKPIPDLPVEAPQTLSKPLSNKEGKSLSGKLRSALYVYFTKSKKSGDFDGFYEAQMEKWRREVLAAIDKLED